MRLTPASLNTPRRKDLQTKKKSLCPASFLCVLASLRETLSNLSIADQLRRATDADDFRDDIPEFELRTLGAMEGIIALKSNESRRIEWRH